MRHLLAWASLIGICPAIAQTPQPAALQKVVQTAYRNCLGDGDTSWTPINVQTANVSPTAPPGSPFTASFTATAACYGTSVTINTSISVSPININATNTGTTATKAGTKYPVWALSPALSITAQATVTFSGGLLASASTTFLDGATTTPGVTGTCPSKSQGVGQGSSGSMSVSQTCTWTQNYQDNSIGGVLAPDAYVQTRWVTNSDIWYFDVDLSSLYSLAATSLMEAFQVTQSLSTDVQYYPLPLIAGKSTTIRMAPISPTNTGLFAGTLHVSRGTTHLGDLTPIYPGLAKAAPQINRAIAGDSLYFSLPGDWTEAGDLTITGDLSGTGTDLPQTPQPLTLHFQPQAAPFRVTYIRYCYQPPGTAKTCPKDRIADLGPILNKLYPVADRGVVYEPLDTPEWVWTKTVLNTKELQRKFMSHMRIIYMQSGVAGNQLLAWLPDGATKNVDGSTLLGSSDPLWNSPTTLLRASIGHTVMLADDNSVAAAADPGVGDVHPLELGNGGTMAHEIGHNLGLRHPNTNDSSAPKDPGQTCWPYTTSTVQNASFDILDNTFVDTGVWDFMGYHETANNWLSPYTYDILVRGGFQPQTDAINRNWNAALGKCVPSSPNHQAPESVSGGDTQPVSSGRAAANAVTTDSVILSGTINANGTGTLAPAYRVTTTGPVDISDPNGAYCIRFTGSSGTLSSFCFNVSFTDPEDQTALSSEDFAFQVGYPAGTTGIGLLSGPQQMAALPVSAHAPTVAFTSPKAGDQWFGGTQTLSWSASDADGDKLNYVLSYSSDGGANFTPLDLDVTGTQYQLDASRIKGGSNVMFRLMASDGINTATATVGPIQLTQTSHLLASALDLGNGASGAPTQGALTISNTGTGPLVVTSFSSDNGVFTVLDPPTPFTILAGTQRNATVQFSPSGNGAQTAHLTIASTDPASPSIVQITGQGFANPVPSAVVNPASLAFGTIAAGITTDLPLTVANPGSADLVVSSVSSSDANFILVGAQFPMTVKTKTLQQLTVRFAPSAAGQPAGTLTINSNDPTHPTRTVSLSGAATAATAGFFNGQAFLGGSIYYLQFPDGNLFGYFGYLSNSIIYHQDMGYLAFIPSTAGQVYFYDFLSGHWWYTSASLFPYLYDFTLNTFVYYFPNTKTSDHYTTNPRYFSNLTTQKIITIGVPQPSLSLSKNSLPFGSVAVGQSTTLTFDIKNTGDATLSVNPITGSGTFSVVSPVGAFSVLAGASQTVTVRFAPSSAGAASATLRISSNDPASPASVALSGTGTAVTSGPVIGLEVATLDFGTVNPATQPGFKDILVKVRNDGNAILTVSAITSSNPKFGAVIEIPPFPVGQGSYQYTTIRYTPTNLAGDTAVITFTSNDPVTPTTTLTFVGNGADTKTGLVGWWKFDEASGAAITDSSGGNNSGTISGGVTRVAGTLAGALSFDGVTGVVNGGTPGTGFPAGSSARTISAWVKVSNPPSTDTAILHYGTVGGAPAVNFHLFITGAGSKVGFGNGYGFGLINGTQSIADGQWHMVAGVYEGAGTNLARIYVDGVQQTSGTLATVPNTGTATPWRIGNFLVDAAPFRGLMDDVRVYARALSSAEIQGLLSGQ